jgi:hypothetical protein
MSINKSGISSAIMSVFQTFFNKFNFNANNALKVSLDSVVANEVTIENATLGTTSVIRDGTTDTNTLSINTNNAAKVSIDQDTANANEVVTKTGSVVTATLNPETTKVIGTVNDKIADGADVTAGAKADVASTDHTATISLMSAVKGILSRLTSIVTGVVLSAGSALIGKVGIDQTTSHANEVVTKTGSTTSIDQTTDGTTNKVQARNATADNFQVNANLQVGDTDVGTSNLIPVDIKGTITNTHTYATIGASTGVALAANASRKYALLINDSDSAIYLMFNASAVLNQGIRLNANGGSYEMSSANGNLDVRVINAISSGASKNLLVTEGV